MMKTHILFFSLLTFALSVFAQNGTLNIQASGFRNTKGLFRYAVYNNKATFMDPRKYYLNGNTKVIGTKVSAKMSLPPGKYAVTVLHEEDSDDNMDFLFGVPTEGFGMSNITSFPFSTPAFEKCLITIEADKTTNVNTNVHYTPL